MFDFLQALRKQALQSEIEALSFLIPRLQMLNPMVAPVPVPPGGINPNGTTSTGNPGGPGNPLAPGPFGKSNSNIANTAMPLVGSKNWNYYSQDIRNSCASFVSTVLIRAGEFQGPEQVVGGGSDFTRSSHILRQELLAKGAQTVLNFAPVGSQADISQLQPGDILIWGNDANPYHHSGIYAGNGRAIATSSSQGVVTTYPVNSAGYPNVSAYRLPSYTPTIPYEPL